MCDSAFNITTDHLFLSHFSWNSSDHCEFFAKLERTLGVPNGRPYMDNARPLENAKRKLYRAYQKHQSDEYCEGIYLISLRKTSTELWTSAGITNFGHNVQERTVEQDMLMIGCISLTTWNRRIPNNCTELFISLLPEHQGRGYATEATRALLQFAEQKYGLTEFFGFVHFNNFAGAARALMGRLGLQNKGIGRRYRYGGFIYATGLMNKETFMALGSPIEYDENLMDLEA